MKNDLEQRLQKNLNDVIVFNNSVINIEQMVTQFESKTDESKKKHETSKIFTSILE